MGAGIPLHVPGVLDRLAEYQEAEYGLHVIGSCEGDGCDDALRSARVYGGRVDGR